MRRFKLFFEPIRPRIHKWGTFVDYPNGVLQNGVGRYVCQLKRLTFFFDKSRNDSIGVRDFIENDFLDFARANAGIAMYLAPRRKAPWIEGEYLNNRRCTVHVSGYGREEIYRWVHYLRSRSGQRIVEFAKDSVTQLPSIQGFWHPFLHQPTQQNVAQFPNEELSRAKPERPTATEQILDLMKQLKNVHVHEEGAEEGHYDERESVKVVADDTAAIKQ